MRKLLIVGIALFAFLFNSPKVKAQEEDTISVMYYNLLNYPLQAQERVDTLKKIIHYVLPDMFVVNELTSLFGANLILSNAMNQNGVTYYEQAAFMNGPDTDNQLYYNSDKLTLQSQQQIATSLRDISEYVVYYNAPDLATTNDTVFFYVYSCHLKAGNQPDNESQRYNEIVTIKNFMSARAGIHNVLFGGDFNYYGDHEAGYTHTLDGGSLKLFDPINQEGAWHNNSSYQDYHTQSTRTTSFNNGATGGMDDRFDFIFVTNDLQTGENKGRYIAGSYEAVGQDGLRFNSSMDNSTPNAVVPADVALALHNMSDHLPVYMEIGVGGDVGIVENDFVSNFLFNSATHEFSLFLENVEEEITLSVYDLTGKLIQTKSAQQVSALEATFSNLKSGIYIVEVSNGETKTSMKVMSL